jgi:hypothetical protein
MPKIKFHSARSYNDKINVQETKPTPTKNKIPDWWKNATLFWQKPDGTPYEIGVDKKTGKVEKGLGFKSCPALMDGFNMGYTLNTPTDIMFIQHNGEPYVLIDEEFKEFCAEREEMPGFKNPEGYHKKHFHWWPNWGIELEEGYSLIVLNPMNRFDLPFLTLSGIIDSDTYVSSGLTPFFLKEGFSGLIPKGTPFAQVIPVKREPWSSEYIYHDEDTIYKRFTEVANRFRKPFGGVYKKEIWSKKIYE